MAISTFFPGVGTRGGGCLESVCPGQVNTLIENLNQRRRQLLDLVGFRQKRLNGTGSSISSWPTSSTTSRNPPSLSPALYTLLRTSISQPFKRSMRNSPADSMHTSPLVSIR